MSFVQLIFAKVRHDLTLDPSVDPNVLNSCSQLVFL